MIKFTLKSQVVTFLNWFHKEHKYLCLHLINNWDADLQNIGIFSLVFFISVILSPKSLRSLCIDKNRIICIKDSKAVEPAGIYSRELLNNSCSNWRKCLEELYFYGHWNIVAPTTF